MLVLGIESSCDETAAAVVDETGLVHSDVVQSQVALHGPYGGVVPELAARDHLKNIAPVVEQALRDAAVSASSLDAVAVTVRPGLAGALLVGAQFARTFAWATHLPLVGVDHLVGHLLSVYLRRPVRGSGALSPPPLSGSGPGATADVTTPTPLSPGVTPAAAPAPAPAEAPAPAAAPAEPPGFPFAALLVSGGHTAIYRVEGPLASQIHELGATRDDAAGEAFDKAAKLLGLGYPGGPLIDRLAALGNPTSHPIPLPMMEGLEFSFSGIKTWLARHVEQHGRPASEQELRDLCASFQRAVVEVLARKLVRAARAEGLPRLVLSGGVAANRGLRARTAELAARHGLALFVPPPASCTDNGAMIAYAGLQRFAAGERDPISISTSTRTSLPRVTRKGRGSR